MLNQAWWTHLAICNMSHRKHVRTLENFFAPNRSQSESEENDTEQEQCINQEETDDDWRKLKKSQTFQKTWLRDHTWSRYEKEAMFCWKSKKTNPFASAEGCANFRPQLCKDIKTITFLVLQGSGKKMFLLACLYECKKKCWIKINLSVPLKIKVSPKILAMGTNCPPVIKS